MCWLTWDDGEPQLILIASGSEVGLIVQAGKRLEAQGVSVRLVSFPSWELFAEQDAAYQNSVLPPGVPLRLAVEAGISQGWHRWVGTQGRVLGLDRFGASGPAAEVFKHLGFSVEHIMQIVMEMLV